MSGPVMAHIDERMLAQVVAENRLPSGATKSEIVRYCLARISGFDHYDALREAEKPRNNARKAKVRENGLTSVGAEIPDSLLRTAMEKLGRTNVSQTIRYALAIHTGKLNETEAENHAVAPAGRTVGRPKKNTQAA